MTDLRFPLLVVPVGIPGCGKSTFASTCVNAGLLGPSQVISTDAIRLALCGDIADQSRNGEVFEYAYEAMKTSLDLDLTTFADATNVTAKAQAQMKNLSIDTGHGALGSQILWVDFLISFEEACERNAARRQPVPDEVMASMYLHYSSIDWDDLARWGIVCSPAGAIEYMKLAVA